MTYDLNGGALDVPGNDLDLCAALPSPNGGKHGAAMIIRPFREGEEGALRQVFLSAVYGTASRDYRPDQVEAWAPASVEPEAWAGRIRAIRPYVAEEGGVILGYADLQPDGYIDHFFVAAEAGGKGVGSALMGRLVETALEKGIPALYSEVSLTARALFERWGFVVEAAQTVVKRGVSLDNFKMRRPMPLARAGDPEAPVEVVDYDPTWPAQFQAERILLEPLLGPWLAGFVEHVGSTAVPGLPAKPVIDLMAPVVSLEASRPAIAAMAGLGIATTHTRPRPCTGSASHRPATAPTTCI